MIERERDSAREGVKEMRRGRKSGRGMRKRRLVVVRARWLEKMVDMGERELCHI